MSVILVVEPDAAKAERIRKTLKSEGLSAQIVESRAEALRSAGFRAPSLLLVSSTASQSRPID